MKRFRNIWTGHFIIAKNKEEAAKIIHEEKLDEIKAAVEESILRDWEEINERHDFGFRVIADIRLYFEELSRFFLPGISKVNPFSIEGQKEILLRFKEIIEKLEYFKAELEKINHIEG